MRCYTWVSWFWVDNRYEAMKFLSILRICSDLKLSAQDMTETNLSNIRSFTSLFHVQSQRLYVLRFWLNSAMLLDYRKFYQYEYK